MANHYLFGLDLDWRYPPELFAGFVPLVWSWLEGLRGVEDRFFAGYDPTWWLFLRRR